MAHDKDRSSPWLVVRGLERSSKERRHAVKLETTRRDIVARQFHVAVAGRIDHIVLQIRDGAVKELILLLKFLKFLEGEHTAPMVRLIQVAKPEHYQMS